MSLLVQNISGTKVLQTFLIFKIFGIAIGPAISKATPPKTCTQRRKRQSRYGRIFALTTNCRACQTGRFCRAKKQLVFWSWDFNSKKDFLIFVSQMYRVFQAGLGARIEVQLNKNPHTTHSDKSWHCTKPSETKQNKTFLNKKHQPKPSHPSGFLVFFPTKTPQFPWVWAAFSMDQGTSTTMVQEDPLHRNETATSSRYDSPTSTGERTITLGSTNIAGWKMPPAWVGCISYRKMGDIPASYVIVYQKVLEAIVSTNYGNYAIHKSPTRQFSKIISTDVGIKDLKRPGWIRDELLDFAKKWYWLKYHVEAPFRNKNTYHLLWQLSWIFPKKKKNNTHLGHTWKGKSTSRFSKSLSWRAGWVVAPLGLSGCHPNSPRKNPPPFPDPTAQKRQRTTNFIHQVLYTSKSRLRLQCLISLKKYWKKNVPP